MGINFESGEITHQKKSCLNFRCDSNILGLRLAPTSLTLCRFECVVEEVRTPLSINCCQVSRGRACQNSKHSCSGNQSGKGRPAASLSHRSRGLSGVRQGEAGASARRAWDRQTDERTTHQHAAHAHLAAPPSAPPRHPPPGPHTAGPPGRRAQYPADRQTLSEHCTSSALTHGGQRRSKSVEDWRRRLALPKDALPSCRRSLHANLSLLRRRTTTASRSYPSVTH